MTWDASFPEADFPAASEFNAEYQQRVASGRQRMSATTAVIGGRAMVAIPKTPLQLMRDARYVRRHYRDEQPTFGVTKG